MLNPLISQIYDNEAIAQAYGKGNIGETLAGAMYDALIGGTLGVVGIAGNVFTVDDGTQETAPTGQQTAPTIAPAPQTGTQAASIAPPVQGAKKAPVEGATLEQVEEWRKAKAAERPVAPARSDVQAAPAEGAEQPQRVGQGTVLKVPYTGEKPTQGSKPNRVTPTVSAELVNAAAQRIADAEKQAANGTGSFKNLLTRAYEAVFNSATNVPVEGLTFGGKPYLVNINKGVPGKVISDVNHSAEKIALLEMLPEIVSNGEYVGSTNGKKNATRYDHFETPVTIGNKPYLVLFETEIYPGSNNYKTHQIKNIELMQQTDEVTGTPPASSESTSTLHIPTVSQNGTGVKSIAPPVERKPERSIAPPVSKKADTAKVEQKERSVAPPVSAYDEDRGF